MNPHVGTLPNAIVERLLARRLRFTNRGGKSSVVREAEAGIVALAMEIAADVHLTRSKRPLPRASIVSRRLIEALRDELTAAGLPWEELAKIRRVEETEASTG